MAEGGNSRSGTRARAQAAAAVRRAAPHSFGGFGLWLTAALEQLRAWTAAEAGPGRLVPWLPVAFGTGLALYFAAEREPALWASVTATVALAAATVLARRRPRGFAVAALATAVAAGFALATLTAARLAHPILPAPVSAVGVSGFVEAREERERSDRIVLRVTQMSAARLETPLQRIRVSVRKKTAPPAGSHVSFTARLSSPPQPTRPGGYDFARDLYFQNIGATGFVLGAIRLSAPPRPPDLKLRWAAGVSSMRDAIDSRIRAALPGDAGAIASALITGKRDAISAPVNEAMYVSSLAHVLSISGYHMALVAGVVFFAIRALLALSPGASSRFPVKKWAAVAALVAATFYLVLSGAEVATRRAYVMTAIVLLGVMVDRPALTLRTMAVAALAVMLLAPEAIVHPSFQMSFAATLALVATYEYGLPWLSAVPQTRRAARIALWGGRQIVTLVIASIVAGLATSLYAAYHFHRFAPYGVLANLLAMPIVSGWVMPMGLIALVAAPFGFDGMFWGLMGEGIAWMIAVAVWVAGLPGAVGRVAAFGIAPVLVGTAGIVLLCLLRTPLRFAGAALLAVAVGMAATAPQPDILVAQDGRMVAVRGRDGRLAVMQSRGDDFALRNWLAADADGRQPKDASLSHAVRCDEAGCVAQTADGARVALARSAEAVAEDCVRAELVVTARAAPPQCRAMLIDRDLLRERGAIALRRDGDRFVWSAARPPGEYRPWSGRTGRAPISEPADATPRAEDLEAGDR
ncbi:MAG: ComEC/Rec2 family competence protein [Pseudorhodoplanes sp.]